MKPEMPEEIQDIEKAIKILQRRRDIMEMEWRISRFGIRIDPNPGIEKPQPTKGEYDFSGRDVLVAVNKYIEKYGETPTHLYVIRGAKYRPNRYEEYFLEINHGDLIEGLEVVHITSPSLHLTVD